MEVCHEWEIEVDNNLRECNFGAQEDFIISFIGLLYKDIDSGHVILSKISSLHFTRIFNPERDKMGAYVRLRVFTEEADLPFIEHEIDNRLQKSNDGIRTFQVRKNSIYWYKNCEEYGGRELAPILRDYLNSISKISFQLLLSKQKGVNVEKVLWSWTHLFFNMIRGYGRGVIEFHQGMIKDFISNV